MRIACLYLPGFLLQVHVRDAPYLVGTAFAVLEERDGGVARIVACSRHAREAGVRIGMTATQARAVAADVKLVDAAPARYREAMRGLGEALLSLSLTVDVEQLGLAYLLVPPSHQDGPRTTGTGATGAAARRSGGARFGEKVLEATARQGLRGRVGIADDRFTAWAATQADRTSPVVVVPPHGSAAFLAPLSLELLPLDPDVKRTLELLGVRTLGDFAALPAPSVGRRWARAGVDVQALARGEDRTPLCAFSPVEPIRETGELEQAIMELEPLTFVLRPLFERVAARLAGRGRAATRVRIDLRGASASGEVGSSEIVLAPARPTTSGRTLLDLARAHLAERKLEHAVTAVAVEVVEEGDPEPQDLDLFAAAGRRATSAASAAEDVDRAIARLRAAFGESAATGVRLQDRHRPEAAFETVPFAPPQAQGGVKQGRRGRILRQEAAPATARRAIRATARAADATARAAAGNDATPWFRSAGVLRLLAPKVIGDELPKVIDQAEVIAARGPTRLEGEWWTDSPLARDYYEVETRDGARYWLYRDHADGRFYLHGIFD